MKRRVLLAVLVVVCVAGLSFGQAPNLISYQGRLVSSSGVPLASGTYDMDFILYDAETVGTAQYTEQHRAADAVTVTGGLFSVTLGGITAFPANLFQAYPQLWMEVVLDPTGTPETFSRVRVVSVPFALEAKHLEGVNATAAQLNELVGGGVTTLHSHPPGAHNHFAAVWSGANAGASGLSVTNTDTTANASGLRGVSGAPQAGIASPVAAGVRGESSTTFGVIGMSDATAGVWGSTFGTNALLAGVYGISYDVPQGVFGLSAMGNGVLGWSNDAAGSGANAANGVFGVTNSIDPLEAGVYGSATYACGVRGVSTNAYGVYGESSDRDGVRGVSNGGVIADNGVYGSTNSNDPAEAGVYGYSSDGASGVYGYNGGTGYGVTAYSLTSVGLYAETGSGVTYAIYGVNNIVGNNPPAIRGESYDGDGVFGISTGGGYADNGVYGETNSTDSTEAGVYGHNSGNGYGGSFVSANYRGLYAQGASGWTDAYFGGDKGIAVNGDVWVNGDDIYGDFAAANSNLRLRGEYNVELWIDDDNDDSDAWVRVHTNNSTSAANEIVRMREDTMSVDCNGPFNANAWDLAEHIGYETGATLVPGDVVVISKTEAGKIALCTEANATNVAGIVSTNPGVVLGNGFLSEKDVAKFLGKDVKDLSAEEFQQNVGKLEAARETVKLALAGQVPCKVSAENGAIAPGDLLTTSATPGHAMKATPVDVGGVPIYRPGTIIGKALEPLPSGTGLINVLAFLQ